MVSDKGERGIGLQDARACGVADADDAVACEEAGGEEHAGGSCPLLTGWRTGDVVSMVEEHE